MVKHLKLGAGWDSGFPDLVDFYLLRTLFHGVRRFRTRVDVVPGRWQILRLHYTATVESSHEAFRYLASCEAICGELNLPLGCREVLNIVVTFYTGILFALHYAITWSESLNSIRNLRVEITRINSTNETV